MKFNLKKVVYKESGENWGTLSPVCFLENFTGDIEEKTTRFYSHDTNQTVTVDLYQVKEQHLPELPDLFQKWIQIKYAIGLSSIESLKELSEGQFYAFLELPDYEKYIFGRLYELKNNPFCLSLFEQIKAHLDKVSNGEKTYKYIFSEKQYSAIQKFRIYRRNAESISNKLYWSKAL